MKYSIFLVSICTVMFTTMAYADTCPEPSCNDPVSQAIRDVARNEEEAFNQQAQLTIAEDKSAIEQCLDGINGFGIGLTLNLPSIDDLFNAACEAIQDEANRRIQDVKGKFTTADLGGIVSGSTTSGGSYAKVTVTDISKEIVNILQGAIRNGI